MRHRALSRPAGYPGISGGLETSLSPVGDEAAGWPGS